METQCKEVFNDHKKKDSEIASSIAREKIL